MLALKMSRIFFKTSCREWRIFLWEKWADANHVRLKYFEKTQIFHEIRSCLIRRTNHEATACLVTDSAQCLETFHAIVKTHLLGMELLVVRF